MSDEVKAKIEVIEIDGSNVRAVAVLPQSRPGELQIAFEDDEFEGGRGRRVVVCMKSSRNMRLDLAAALLSADGAKADIRLTWPKPEKKGAVSARCSKRAKNGAKA